MVGWPILAELILAGLLFNIAAGLVEAIFPIWAMDLGVIEGPRGMMPIFLCSGLVLAFCQGGLVGRLAPVYGEHRLLIFGAFLYGVSVLMTSAAGAAQHYVAVILTMTLQTAAMAFIITPLQSLVSLRAAASEQGMVMGVYSSVGTLGRVVGPIVTGMLYAELFPAAPFYSAALVSAVLLGLAVLLMRRW